MIEPMAIVEQHLPFLKYGVWQPRESDPVELVFHGMGVFGGYFTTDDEVAVSYAEGVLTAYLWSGQLRVKLQPGAEPQTVGKTIVDLLLAIRCLNEGVQISDHFDTPGIFRP